MGHDFVDRLLSIRTLATQVLGYKPNNPNSRISIVSWPTNYVSFAFSGQFSWYPEDGSDMSRVIMTRHLGWLIPLFKLYVFSETSIMFPNLVVVSYSFL